VGGREKRLVELFQRETLTYNMLIDDSSDGTRKRYDLIIAEVSVALGFDGEEAERYVYELVENPKASLKIARDKDGKPLYDTKP
jgi:hypothetical protein